MAFNAGKWEAGVQIRDNNKNAAVITALFDAALTLAEVETRMAAIAAAAVDLTDGYVSSYQITRIYFNDAIDPENQSSEVERKLSITLTDAQGQQKRVVQFPSPIFGLEVPGTDVVSPAQTQVAAFLSALYANGSAAGGAVLAAQGNPMSATERIDVRHRPRKPRQ